MTTMYLSASAFSALAVLMLFPARGRAHRLISFVLVLLLMFPLGVLMPKIEVLPAAMAEAASGRPFAAVLPAVFVSVTLLGLVRLFVEWMRLLRWRRESRTCEVRPISNRREIEFRVHPEVRTPCAAGIVHPLIFLPTDWTRWSPDTRAMILAHESAHHERRDPLWRLIAGLACALHWFNPFVWWLARRQSLHSEIACDAAVIASGFDPGDYAHALCDLAEGTSTPLTAAASGPTLRHRIRELGGHKRPLPKAASVAVGLVIAIAALGAATLRHASSESPGALPSPANKGAEIELRLSADPFPGNP